TPTPITPQTIATTPSEVQVLGEETNESKVVVSATIFDKTKSFIQKIISSPRESVNYIYGGIALFVVLALLLVIFIKSEIQHPAIIGRGIALVAVILFLLFVNIQVLTLDTKIPEESLEASVIAY
ncbi:MAG: hypothetical protein AAB895_00875, partial [Patescibacteria group bacterium]